MRLARLSPNIIAFVTHIFFECPHTKVLTIRGNTDQVARGHDYTNVLHSAEFPNISHSHTYRHTQFTRAKCARASRTRFAELCVFDVLVYYALYYTIVQYSTLCLLVMYRVYVVVEKYAPKHDVPVCECCECMCKCPIIWFLDKNK